MLAVTFLSVWITSDHIKWAMAFLNTSHDISQTGAMAMMSSSHADMQLDADHSIILSFCVLTRLTIVLFLFCCGISYICYKVINYLIYVLNELHDMNMKDNDMLYTRGWGISTYLHNCVWIHYPLNYLLSIHLSFQLTAFWFLLFLNEIMWKCIHTYNGLPVCYGDTQCTYSSLGVLTFCSIIVCTLKLVYLLTSIVFQGFRQRNFFYICYSSDVFMVTLAIMNGFDTKFETSVPYLVYIVVILGMELCYYKRYLLYHTSRHIVLVAIFIIEIILCIILQIYNYIRLLFVSFIRFFGRQYTYIRSCSKYVQIFMCIICSIVMYCLLIPLLEYLFEGDRPEFQFT